MNIEEEICALEVQGVFIKLSYDHYNDGTNCNFSIDFHKLGHNTMRYGDNHEFGDTANVLIAGIKFAKWFLEDEDRFKWFFYSKHETITEEGYANWLKCREVRTSAHMFLRESYVDKTYIDY